MKNMTKLKDKLCYEEYRYKPPTFCDLSVEGHRPYQTTYCRAFKDWPYKDNADADHLKVRYHLRDEGLPSLLTTTPAHRFLDSTYNTQYCEDYNKVPRRNLLPPVRYHNMHRRCWSPEKSDHPVVGKPWSYGFLQLKRKIWVKQQNELNRISSALDYFPESTKYSRYRNTEYQHQKKHATPCTISSKFFNPRGGITRGPPLLFQPNQITGDC